MSPRPRARTYSPLARTVALMLIAGTLGAWAAFLLINWDRDTSHHAGAAPQHHSQLTDNQSPSTDAAGHHSEGGMQMAVVDMMAADPVSMRACVGSSLEPFTGAMTQLRANGPHEAGERMRSCVFDTIIGHGDDATMAELESHRPQFEGCFGSLTTTEPADKTQAVERVTACVLDGLPQS